MCINFGHRSEREREMEREMERERDRERERDNGEVKLQMLVIGKEIIKIDSKVWLEQSL